MSELGSEEHTFGECEECGAPRFAVMEDGDLTLQCANGHSTS